MPRVPRTRLSKHWTFTINNPINADRVSDDLFSYIIYGNEVGLEGTPHLQGYVCFKNRQRLSAVKKLFPRAHLEIKRGSVQEAIDYCKKDGDFVEEGLPPVTAAQATQDRWDRAKQSAMDGDLDDIPSDMLIKYLHAFKRLAQDHPVKPEDLVVRRNKWIVAPSGYGKSTYARKKYPDFYDKAPNKWFIGYRGQETLLCDDFGPSECQYLGWYLKRWADNFAFPMETKGGGMMIRPKRVIVTSQYTIRECFPDRPLIADAINNRFAVVNLEHWMQRRTIPPIFHFDTPLTDHFPEEDEENDEPNEKSTDSMEIEIM